MTEETRRFLPSHLSHSVLFQVAYGGWNSACPRRRHDKGLNTIAGKLGFGNQSHANIEKVRTREEG